MYTRACHRQLQSHKRQRAPNQTNAALPFLPPSLKQAANAAAERPTKHTRHGLQQCMHQLGVGGGGCVWAPVCVCARHLRACTPPSQLPSPNAKAHHGKNERVHPRAPRGRQRKREKSFRLVAGHKARPARRTTTILVCAVQQQGCRCSAHQRQELARPMCLHPPCRCYCCISPSRRADNPSRSRGSKEAREALRRSLAPSCSSCSWPRGVSLLSRAAPKAALCSCHPADSDDDRTPVLAAPPPRTPVRPTIAGAWCA